jgi:hypothetical protein
MTISSVREFRDNATGLLRSKSPILVMRRGKLAGVFFPWPESTLPADFKKDLFSVLSAELGRQLKRSRIVEDEIVADFDSWRKGRRETRGRR